MQFQPAKPEDSMLTQSCFKLLTRLFPDDVAKHFADFEKLSIPLEVSEG